MRPEPQRDLHVQTRANTTLQLAGSARVKKTKMSDWLQRYCFMAPHIDDPTQYVPFLSCMPSTKRSHHLRAWACPAQLFLMRRAHLPLATGGLGSLPAVADRKTASHTASCTPAGAGFTAIASMVWRAAAHLLRWRFVVPDQ